MAYYSIKKPDDIKATNPQGKVPVLVENKTGTKIPESDTILRYVIDKYADQGPSYRPSKL